MRIGKILSICNCNRKISNGGDIDTVVLVLQLAKLKLAENANSMVRRRKSKLAGA